MAGPTYVQRIPKDVYEKQLHYQTVQAYTHMKGPRDKVISFIVPTALVATAGFLMGRGLWNMYHGTGKKD